MKRLLKIGIASLLLIAGISSCTYGEIDESGGDLVILNIPLDYVNQIDIRYIGITTPDYAFNPALKRITDTVIRAALYKNGEVYTGDEQIQLSFAIYPDNTTTSGTMSTMTNKTIQFHSGAGFVKWMSP